VLRFDTQQVTWLTGMAVTSTEARNALTALGFEVEAETDDRYLHVTIPSWRADVVESADLVEEIARILGYERIPSTIPTGPLPEPLRESWFERESYLRDVLVGAGLTEIITYALISRTSMASLLVDAAPGAERLLTAAASVPEPDADVAASASPRPRGRTDQRREIEAAAERLPAIVLRNPLSSEQEALRLTLMPGLLNTLRENGKYGEAGLWFFELGRRYLSTPEMEAGTGLAQERRTLGVALMGPHARVWNDAERPADFYDLKGVADTVLRALKISAYRYVPVRHPSFHPGRCAALELAVAAPVDAAPASDRAVAESSWWVRAGVLGEVHPEVAQRWDLPQRAYLMELDLSRVFSVVPERVVYQPLSRFPSVERDLAVVVDQSTPEIEVRQAIRAAGGDLVRQVRLFDVYTGETIAQDKKSLAYSLTYQSSDRTLTDKEVDAVQARILDALRKSVGATLRT
ncbi:MAG TPA: phenylalanine--tRNA ligase subunit beta, partial [Ktedonobacterales bacterium]